MVQLWCFLFRPELIWFRYDWVVAQIWFSCGLIIVPCGFQGSPGCLGCFSGFFWSLMEFSGLCWVFMFVYGLFWVSPGFSGFLWVSPGLVAQRVLWIRVHPGTSMCLLGTSPPSKGPMTTQRVLWMRVHAEISMWWLGTCPPSKGIGAAQRALWMRVHADMSM